MQREVCRQKCWSLALRCFCGKEASAKGTKTCVCIDYCSFTSDPGASIDYVLDLKCPLHGGKNWLTFGRKVLT